MNDELKNALEEALPEKWTATGASSDDAIARGNRIRTRRRLTAAGGGMLGVAGVTAVTIALLPGLVAPPSGGQAATEDEDSGVTEELPSLDADSDYYWSTPLDEYEENTELTDSYTEAVRDWFAAEMPDVEISDGLEESGHEDDPPVEVEVHRTGHALIEDVNGDGWGKMGEDPADNVVHEQVFYVAEIRMSDGSYLDLRVWPRGGYKDDGAEELYTKDGTFIWGSGDAPAQLIPCGDHETTIDNQIHMIKPECIDVKGPNNETAVSSVYSIDGEVITGFETAGALYRSDGTAVNYSYTPGIDDGELVEGDGELLEAEDLEKLSDKFIELLGSLPNDPVK